MTHDDKKERERKRMRDCNALNKRKRVNEHKIYLYVSDKKEEEKYFTSSSSSLR